MDRIEAMHASRQLPPRARKLVERRLLEAGMGRDDPLAVIVVLEVAMEEKLAQVRGLPAAIATELDSAGQRQAAAHAEAVVAGVQTRLAPTLTALGRRSVLAAGRRTALALVVGGALCLGAGVLIGEQRLLARQVPLNDVLTLRADADSWARLIASNPFSLDALLQKYCGATGPQVWIGSAGRGCTVPLWLPDQPVPAPGSLAQLAHAAQTWLARFPAGGVALAGFLGGLGAGLLASAVRSRMAWRGHASSPRRARRSSKSGASA